MSLRTPSPPGPVLVVGGGNTGFQIAEELAARAARCDLSIAAPGSPYCRRNPGKDLFSCLDATGLISDAGSRLGRRMSGRDFIVGFSPRRLRRRKVSGSAAGVADAHGRTIRLSDSTSLDVGTVVWATGYRPDYSWIDIPAWYAMAKVIHRRGVTEVPGLYFLGLPWQHTRGSALLGFVKDDAQYLVQRIRGYADTAPARPAPSASAATLFRIGERA